MSFSPAFSAAFAAQGVESADYIGPVMAQSAIAAGDAVEVSGGRVRIGGRLLIGPAGKPFEFSSDANALKWCDVAAARAAYEPLALAGMSDAARAAWVGRKRARLALIARRVVEAASRQVDSGKRRALVAEADFCLVRWG